MTTNKLISSIIAGAAVGAVLGVLFAPSKGTETRKKIAEKGAKLGDAIKEGSESISNAVSRKYENIKEHTAELLRKGKDKSPMETEEGKRQPAF